MADLVFFQLVGNYVLGRVSQCLVFLWYFHFFASFFCLLKHSSSSSLSNHFHQARSSPQVPFYSASGTMERNGPLLFGLFPQHWDQNAARAHEVTGSQFNWISTDCSTWFSTERLVLQSVLYSVENPVEHPVEIELNWVPDSEPPPPSRFPRVEDSKIIGALQECRATNMCIVENTGLEEDSSGEELADSSEELISSSEGALEDEDESEESVVGWGPCDSWSHLQMEELHCAGITSSFGFPIAEAVS